MRRIMKWYLKIKVYNYDKNPSDMFVTVVPMPNNRIFPMRFREHNNSLANMTQEDEIWFCHLRYVHLNFHDFKFLAEKISVFGLSKVEE